MKYLKLFENFRPEPGSIAVELLASVSGLGTDEPALVKAVERLKTPAELQALDRDLAAIPDSGYKSLKALIADELGAFDQRWIKQLETHLAKIGAAGYLTAGPKRDTGKRVEVKGEYSPNAGDWDGMHSFQSRVSDGFGGKMNDLVNEALVGFYEEHQLNPDITKIEITMDETGSSKWSVKWKVIIEESKDGKAWIGLTSRGGAGQPDGPSGSIKRAQTQIDDKIQKLSSEFRDPELQTKQVLDFNHKSRSGSTHVRQIFVVYTNPAKYPPYQK